MQNNLNTLSGESATQISTLQNELNALSGESATQISTLQNELNALSGESATQISTLQNELNALSGESATQINTLQNELNALSGESATQISTLQNELNYLNRHKFIYEFDLASENNRLSSIWSDGNTMWVLNNANTAKIFAYSMTTVSGAKIRLPMRDINNVSGLGANGGINTNGIFSDGNTMWVPFIGGSGDTWAFNIRTGTRDMSKDFILFDPIQQGFVYGTTIYGTDHNFNGNPIISVIRAFNLSNKSRISSQDFNTLSGARNTLPSGLWTDGETMWVADSGDDKIYAYNLQTKARDESKDFNTLLGAGNTNPRGIWSDGQTMWVGDRDDNKIYAYDMTTKMRR